MTYKAVSKVHSPKSPDASFRALLIGTKDAAQMRTLIADGKVRGSALRKMRLTLDLTIDDIADILGISHRTLVRKEQGKTTLSPAEADRAYRLARIADLAVELIGDGHKAFAWMRTSNTYLGGETPVRMLDTEIGTDLVVESLHSIAYGGVA